MESCLSGLQFEASSCAAYRLILRAYPSGGGVELVIKSPYFRDYVYLWLFSVKYSQKKLRQVYLYSPNAVSPTAC